MTDFGTAAELRHVIKHLNAELRAIESRTVKPPTPEPITDHAVVRYMERVKGTYMRRLRMEILPDHRRSLLSAGVKKIKCSGYEPICSRGVVITVMG